MATAEQADVRVRCRSCGDEFWAPDRRWLYCSECKDGRATLSMVSKRVGWIGAPFSLEHFRSWAEQLELDTGSSWRLEPFQEAFIGDWLEGFPECWLVVPEGNGKTTLMAAMGLYHCQFKHRASVSLAASSREQAEIAYLQAEGLVENSDSLRGVFRCFGGFRRIVCDAESSRLQVKAADDRTGDGIIPTLCLVDELHRHRDLKLYRTWRGKLRKRRGQIVTISTAGEPGSEFEQTRERIRQSSGEVARDGSFLRAATDQLVLHEWAVAEDGDVEDLSVVKAANPLEHVTVELLREALESPTMTLSHWRRFVCNLPTRGDAAAVNEAEWDGAVTADRPAVGESVDVGLDLGWKWDTTAIVPLWSASDGRRVLFGARVLDPPRDGTSLDPDLVEAALLEVHERNPIGRVVMDMTNGEQLAVWIERTLGAQVVERGTGNAAATVDYARFMEGLRSGELQHDGDPVLRQHVLNAVARMLPGGDPRFDRPRASRTVTGELARLRVIDALTAAGMVNAVVAANDPAPWVSAW